MRAYCASTVKHFADSYGLFADAQGIVEHLITHCGEFDHLQRAELPCILSQRALVERGRAMPGVIITPTSEGLTSSAKRNFADFLIARFVRELCEDVDPDFILMLDVALWPKPAIEQEHLLYHLLSHLEQKVDKYDAPMWHEDGRAHLRLRAHDIERFINEVQRYGSTIEGIKDERGVYAATRARQLRITG